MLGLQIQQTDAVMGSWETTGLWPASTRGQCWGLDCLEHKGSGPASSGLQHIFLKKKNKYCCLIIICLTSSCKEQHALPFPSSVLGITVCNCSFVFSDSWNPSAESSCHGGLQQCHRDAAQWLCFIAFYRWSLPKKNQCKKHRVRMLPVVFN